MVVPELPPSVAEIVLAVGGGVLNIFVLPALWNTDAQIPRSQSIPFAVVLLCGFSYSYYSIGLYIPMLMTMLGSLLWAYIALYRSVDPDRSS
jgi:hypothetical protein